MIEIKEKKDCCGCTACFNICPTGAITMEADEEGFLYPAVDRQKCIGCGLCKKVCPILHSVRRMEKTEGYIIRYRDEKIVEESTSGGAFTAFASYFLDKGGIVYGAGYDSDMRVVHKAALRQEELQEMRGSKFVQSELGLTFQEIKSRLKEGKHILFTGTPCQTAGLCSFLGGKPENLLCIDFVCRGVPSPGLWKNYVSWMEQKYGSKMTGARFKHKTYGYHATTMKIDFANGRTWYGSGRVDPMMKAFVSEMASRPSCHACAFKGIERLSDITIFDCYEFSQITGKRDDDKGYSSILVHTEQGRDLLNQIKENLTVYKVEIDRLITENGIMVCHSAKESSSRALFYSLAAGHPIDEALQRTNPIRQKDYLIERMKGFVYRTGLIGLLRRVRKRHSVEIVK